MGLIMITGLLVPLSLCPNEALVSDEYCILSMGPQRDSFQQSP